jgi:hypothetical protein
MARPREMISSRGGETAAAVERAMRCLGTGVDMAGDQRLRHCKIVGGCLVARSGGKATVTVPGVGVVVDVPVDVKCAKGGRTRLRTDVLEFNKVR